MKKQVKTNGKIAVLGLGREGLALLKFLKTLKIKPVGLSNQDMPKKSSEYKKLALFASELFLGREYLKNLSNFDLVFRSPGVPLDLPEIRKAKRKGVRFSSLTQLFFDTCPARIIGVTGTKGKSTTASLIFHLLKANYPKGKVYFGGNIGIPPLQYLPKLTKNDLVVLELSSFQLEDLEKSPHIAVVLPISPEHLDRHKTMAKYTRAKMNLIKHQGRSDFMVVEDSTLARKISRLSKGKLVTYSQNKILPKGLYVNEGQIIYRELKSGHRHEVIKVSDLPVAGKHNINNVLAASLIALIIGVKPQNLKNQIKRFKSLEHRLEPAYKKDDVQFINDSMGTTPIATMAALDAISDPVSLILGGADKQTEFSGLAKYMKKQNNILGVTLIGATAPKIKKALREAKVTFEILEADNFKMAINKAYKLAKPNGVVLLSPACASFGWFKSAYDRGDQFKVLVKKL
ncbi:MAG: UDP-N-acetylmuramoyl-L-alanine--D-glutamate ligase [Patescibacteria group bacterium]|nr:UDP-N-acetylmuramoyl-L-alanine--D-glutamate ligase [Patescibacteria group bacterium]